jgi:signal transduction histidine kinase
MLLSTFVLADLVLAGLLGASLGEGPVTVLAAVIVAGVYVPFRRRLRRLVARVVSGEREEPYAVIAGLAEELEHVHTSQEQLDIVTRAIVRAFRTPYVRLELERADGSTLTSEDGAADVVGEPRPIAYRGRVIGSLTMAPARLPRLSRRDRRLLDDLVRQAAAAVSASDANDQLRSIRTALVNAREDERRRMRDELHDGVGPVLAGVVLRLDAVAGRLGSEHALRESISALADDASKAVDEVRRISQGLGPAALAELGLERAVLEQCERLSAGDGCRISARVELGAPLPVATDVAVYRIVSEALTNVVRHSGARTASVRITATADAVEVEIADDGRGLPQTVAPGTGLASQRQRALELGGTWSAGPAPGGGTRVHATIPLTTATTEGQPA